MACSTPYCRGADMLMTGQDYLDSIRQGFGDNIHSYHRHMRRNDIFVSHTVTNPQGWRPVNPAEPPRQSPTLRVVAEDDAGVTINGLKMLGTASVFCHETWCGNL